MDFFLSMLPLLIIGFLGVIVELAMIVGIVIIIVKAIEGKGKKK